MFLSKSAEDYFKNKIKDNMAIELRLKNSGCSGFAYLINIVNKSNNNILIKNIPFDILNEDKSFFNDVLIDLKKDGINSQIVFENTKAFNYCGCGESFSIRK